MSVTGVKIGCPEQAFLLPLGGLAVSCFQASFSRESVYEAAELLIEKNDVDGLETQAEVIARAGKHGWGQGDAYQVIGGPADNDADLPPEKASIVNLCTPKDALRLPEGRLVLGSIEASFGETDVLSAAKLLIEQNDGQRLVSQAGVIVRAGKHGWGQGDVYSTI